MEFSKEKMAKMEAAALQGLGNVYFNCWPVVHFQDGRFRIVFIEMHPDGDNSTPRGAYALSREVAEGLFETLKDALEGNG